MFEAEALEFPWMSTLPKGEKRQVENAKQVYAELKALQEKVGTIVPVVLAAGILNVSRQRVTELGEQGKLKVYKAAGHVWVSGDELVEFAKLERKTGRPPKAPSFGECMGMAREIVKESRKK